MNLNKVVEAIHNINEYASVSQNDDWEVIQMETVQLNMSTVLSMRKIQTFEIEYFNKYGENGLACIAMTLILQHPPSKIWAVLGKELVTLLKYWLDAMRKHLINHNPIWFSFLKVVITFIKEIRQKHTSIPNILVEQTAECLLDISINKKSNECQKLEILQCLNMYCAESSREIRFAMRNKFSDFFIKLSAYMSTCGHFPCQFIIMETLLRWLVPRQNRDVRSSSANKWFPRELYSKETVDMFLERPWTNFFQDARDFLNAHNEANDLILSLICKRLCIGDVEIISGTEKQVSWLDINSRGSCMSIFLDPQMLDKFGVQNNHKACEVLIVSEENTSTVQLYSESQLNTISVTTISAPQMYPSSIEITEEGTTCLQFVVSSHTDLKKLDKALRKIFRDKYHLIMHLKDEHTLSPPKQTSQSDLRNNRFAREVKFSQPAGRQRGRRSGYVLRSKNPTSYSSPSSTSTTSLARLHGRLEALPRYKYDNRSLRVCESPTLTKVTEASETDDRQTLNSASDLKFSNYRHHGVRHMSILEGSITNVQNGIEVKTNATDKLPDKNADYSTSCLLIATIGSTDDSVISNTIERLSKNKEYKPDNIVDLLIKEALESNIKESDRIVDGDIDTDANKETEGIEKNSKATVNTVFTELKVTPEKHYNQNSTVRNRSTSTDDSNANIINETPVNYVTFRTKKKLHKTKPLENVFNGDVLNKFSYDETLMNDIFQEQVIQNSDSNIAISSTLTKKNNDFIPGTSEGFAGNIFNEISSQNNNLMLHDVEIYECLNSIIDKVCSEYINFNHTRFVEVNMMTNREEEQIHSKESSQNEKSTISAENLEPHKKKFKNSLQLKFPIETRTVISGKAKRVTKNSKKKKNEKDTAFNEYDVTITNDEFEKPPKLNTKGKYNRKKKNNAKLLDYTNSQGNDTKIDDNTGKENIICNDQSSSLRVGNPQETETVNDKTPAGALRRKRKLYSPMMEQSNNEFSEKQVLDVDENMVHSNLKSKSKWFNTRATSYKDIENERRSYIRRPRNLRSRTKVEEMPSPRSKKNNEVFDKLKETVENNNNEILVDVKSANCDVYNFTSESEDEDFKPKKTYARKLTATGSVEAKLSTTHETVTKPVKYTRNNSNKKKNSNKSSNSNKVVKAPKKRSNKRKMSIPIIDLVDEKMRQLSTEVLNTSIVIGQPKTVVNDQPVPVLSEIPHMEEYSILDEEIEAKKNTTKNGKTKPSIISNKNSQRDARSDDRTVSPLPELIVETATVAKNDPFDSFRPDMLQTFKKLCNDTSDVDSNGTNNTQHQLLDIEHINQNKKSFNDEIQADRSVISKCERSIILNNNRKTRKAALNKNHLSNTEDNFNHQGVIEIPEFDLGASIASIGITAHGVSDEIPPNIKDINRKVSPRKLELEELDKSSQDYFIQLESTINRFIGHSQSPKLKTCERLKILENRVDKIPYVSLTRLSINDIKNVVISDDNLSKISANSSGTVQQSKKSKISDSKTSVIIEAKTKSTTDRLLTSSVDSKNYKKNTEIIRPTKVNIDLGDASKSVSEKSFIIKFNKHKWLPSSRNSESDCQDNTLLHATSTSNGSRQSKTAKDSSNGQKTTKSETKTSPHAEMNRTNVNHNTLHKAKHAKTNVVDSEKTKDLCVNRPITRQAKRIERKETTTVMKNSVISPVKLDLFANNQARSSQIIKDNIQQIKDTSENPNTYKSTQTSDCSTRRVLTKNRGSEDQNLQDISKTSSEISRMKLKRTATIDDGFNKRKLYETPSVSDNSVLNVDAWFSRNETAPDKDSTGVRSIMVDILQRVFETLESTVEIDTNTTKKFVHVIVDIERELIKREQKRRTEHVESIKRLLDEFQRRIHAMSTDIDNNFSANATDGYIERKVRESISEILLQTTRQKRVAVQILKEDIQAIVGHLMKNRKE